MEGLLCSNTVVYEGFSPSLMEALALEIAIAASKALALSLFMMGSLPNGSSVLPEESGTSQGCIFLCVILSSPVFKSRILGSCKLQLPVDSWGMKMEGLLCSNTVVLECFLSSLMEAVVLETAIAASKALALSLFMIGSLPTGSRVFPEESGTSQGLQLSVDSLGSGAAVATFATKDLTLAVVLSLLALPI
ncbi:hypothetical protein H0E87_011718 [Populus deltoides]|uniref:Uncharacterized protein n=1 Tax=Populus deltoides TaxID=3696 RepID=A0A8T2YGD9_POPDE|nr:hypothetical protein H0E87_011718 [Populus deltoides]